MEPNDNSSNINNTNYNAYPQSSHVVITTSNPNSFENTVEREVNNCCSCTKDKKLM